MKIAVFTLPDSLTLLPSAFQKMSMAQKPGVCQAVCPHGWQSHSKLAIAGHPVQVPSPGMCSQSLVPTPPTPTPMPGPLGQLLRESWAQWEGDAARSRTATAFPKATPQSLPSRTLWWAQFVCYREPPCPQSIFITLWRRSLYCHNK